jgi:hypothetical protein
MGSVFGSANASIAANPSKNTANASGNASKNTANAAGNAAGNASKNTANASGNTSGNAAANASKNIATAAENLADPKQGGYRPTKKDKAALKKWKQGKSIGFTMKSSLKAKGLLPRANGTRRISNKYKN